MLGSNIICVHMCLFVTCICMYACMYVAVHMYLCFCESVCFCTKFFPDSCVGVCVCLYACVGACVCTSVCLSVCLYVCMCMYLPKFPYSSLLYQESCFIFLCIILTHQSNAALVGTQCLLHD